MLSPRTAAGAGTDVADSSAAAGAREAGANLAAATPSTAAAPTANGQLAATETADLAAQLEQLELEIADLTAECDRHQAHNDELRAVIYELALNNGHVDVLRALHP